MAFIGKRKHQNGSAFQFWIQVTIHIPAKYLIFHTPSALWHKISELEIVTEESHLYHLGESFNKIHGEVLEGQTFYWQKDVKWQTVDSVICQDFGYAL